MFSKKKNTGKMDAEQRELYENARKRSLQKKRLFLHFIIFLVGSIFLIVLNVLIGFKENIKPLGYNWFVWVVLIWGFLFLIHFLNVFVVNSFMGKEWQDKHTDKLVRKQQQKIEELQRKVEKDHPLEREKTPPPPKNDNDQKFINPQDPNKPLNS